jgi:chromosome segregation ATPase
MFLFIPAFIFADYTVIMKNGTELTGIKSYTEKGDEIYFYLEKGYMIFPKKDIIGIEGFEAAETEESEIKTDSEKTEDKDTGVSRRTPVTQEQSEKKTEEIGKTRLNELTNEYKSIMSEIRSLEARENSLVNQINEKSSKRFNYNKIQLIQLEKEIEPLNNELKEVKQKKAELVERKKNIENELQEIK